MEAMNEHRFILGAELREGVEVEVSRDGLEELKQGDLDPFGDPVAVDPIRDAEHELISAYADAHAIDYATAVAELIAQGKLD